MLNEFIMWMQEPGKWNDGVVLCGITAVVCLVLMLKVLISIVNWFTSENRWWNKHPFDNGDFPDYGDHV